MFFSWPGDDGQGKEPPPSDASPFLFSKICALKVTILEKLPGGLQYFARSPSPDRAKKDLLYALCASVVRLSCILFLESKSYGKSS